MKADNKNIDLSINLNRARLLIVDDEERLLTSLKELLIANHYQVDTALGGKNSCIQLMKQQYDLVLLDLRMGDFSGHQVMDFMSEHQINAATIVVSGESTFSAVSKALRRGAYDYLKKPYVPEELLATVENALQKKLLEKAHNAMQIRLKKSEELHRYIVNSSPDIVFMLDKEGRFTFINNKVESVLGYHKRELLGQHYEVIINDKDAERAGYIFKDSEQSGRTTRTLELHLKSRGDSRAQRYFEVTVFPIESSSVTGKQSANNRSLRQLIGTYGTARDITERKEAEDFINFQAYHDLLTRLPNRALFKDRLSLAITHAKRNTHGLAVMFLDLDRFKIVNDTLGHAMGDRLLQSVSMRLENCLREGDTLSRFGGDEFTLLLPDISSKECARKIARKVINVLKEPFMLGEHEVFVGVSVGIAMYEEAGKSVEQLIQNADIAMYHVKRRGKDGYQFYSDTMNVTCSNRLKIERDMRNALDNKEFRVYYQPQINAATDGIIGVEALIRWHHPERGIIYPSEFIPLAEETKLIVDISEWVLKTACAEVKSWITAGHENIRLAVNFSPSQVEHPRFVSMLFKQLEEYDFPPENLEIELTENVIMNDLEHMIQKLSKLADHGITIAIDDFGTGYSSLNYLHKLPIHTLKVDQSFVHDIQSSENEACIVNAIVAMAHGLKLNIVAEGVETASQLEYLKSLGCHEIQGFFFGKARPADETIQLINRNVQSKAS
ncbi:EAL domain-containing protein [Alkalimarinus coralli]|uniref:EAL domain-containing protein n=1 Tax=Alkalimarinus coralli TaxID=2935863 RepID=UPI00202B6A17|nr:EAL domain-containing protein [Alkalimarinus coralli]